MRITTVPADLKRTYQELRKHLPSKRVVEKIEVLAGNRIVYRAEFRRMRSLKQYRVPMRLVISNDNGDVFQLDIERYWANVSVTPDMFVLNPPVR